ncbi:MAG: hypothetical protein GVY18_15065 [Bacteroidetes bacterium]|jgi:hypothetical protein|nr:hypothetical protein [Bacteroidota bacterium]
MDVPESHPPEVPAAGGLQALLAQIVDYAGLFPPAGLPLDEALPNYARYRRSPDAWMLARFVIPRGRLEDLAAHRDVIASDPPFVFSVLGTGGDDDDAFLDALTDDVATIEAFHAEHRGLVRADVMEVRLPPSLLGAGADDVTAFLEAVDERVADLGLTVFFEVPLDDDLRTTAPPLLHAMAAFNRVRDDVSVGFKMRTGGLDPDAIPSAEHVAAAVLACRDAGVAFKATAGLHHPVRHVDETLGVPMHGFFNLFGGAALAVVHDLDAAALVAILEDDDPDHFRFTGYDVAWQDLSAPADAVARTRETLATSFGSCSFDEPRDDLRTLGLL